MEDVGWLDEWLIILGGDGLILYQSGCTSVGSYDRQDCCAVNSDTRYFRSARQ